MGSFSSKGIGISISDELSLSEKLVDIYFCEKGIKVAAYIVDHSFLVIKTKKNYY